MSDPRKPSAASTPDPEPAGASETGGDDAAADIFSSSPNEPSNRGILLVIAALAVAAILGGLFLPRGDRASHAAAKPLPNTILSADPYAASLIITQPAMSQSTSIAGGTSTFLDGHVRNTGTSTVTAVTMQVVFRNDAGMSPQVESLPLSVITMRQPYIDTQPLAAAPLKPGEEADFRLIFEHIPENWNQQMPEVIPVHVTLK